MGGLRVEPRLSFGRIFADVDAGVGLTGGRARLALAASVGVEFNALRWLRMGSVLRYGRLFATEQEDFPSDAQFFTFGLGVAMGAPATTRRCTPARG
jgi:hypothetical protein